MDGGLLTDALSKGAGNWSAGAPSIGRNPPASLAGAAAAACCRRKRHTLPPPRLVCPPIPRGEMWPGLPSSLAWRLRPPVAKARTASLDGSAFQRPSKGQAAVSPESLPGSGRTGEGQSRGRQSGLWPRLTGLGKGGQRVHFLPGLHGWRGTNGHILWDCVSSRLPGQSSGSSEAAAVLSPFPGVRVWPSPG